MDDMKLYSKAIEKAVEDIRGGRNKAFAEWAQYGVDPEEFISIFRWMAEEKQEEREGHLFWARAVGLIVPHEYRQMLIGGFKFYQTGPAELHRLKNRYLHGIGLALIDDMDSDKSWLYHTWPHLTLRDILDQKPYPLEDSLHNHPELDKFKMPDK